jgi:hypothetical protein
MRHEDTLLSRHECCGIEPVRQYVLEPRRDVDRWCPLRHDGHTLALVALLRPAESGTLRRGGHQGLRWSTAQEPAVSAAASLHMHPRCPSHRGSYSLRPQTTVPSGASWRSMQLSGRQPVCQITRSGEGTTPPPAGTSAKGRTESARRCVVTPGLRDNRSSESGDRSHHYLALPRRVAAASVGVSLPNPAIRISGSALPERTSSPDRLTTPHAPNKAHTVGLPARAAMSRLSSEADHDVHPQHQGQGRPGSRRDEEDATTSSRLNRRTSRRYANCLGSSRHAVRSG